MKMRLNTFLALVCLLLSALLSCQHASRLDAGKTLAPYAVNPRYFAGGPGTPGGNGKPLVLIGDYTWGTFSDVGYDYKAMFDEIAAHKQNFARVWFAPIGDYSLGD